MAEVVEVAKSGSRGISHYMQVLGPGILGAAAAIGGSHLVASTQAGARFGWQLIGLILLVNLLKYPFFQIGARYTMAADETLIQGYDRIGRGYLYLFIYCAELSGLGDQYGWCGYVMWQYFRAIYWRYAECYPVEHDCTGRLFGVSIYWPLQNLR